MLLVTYSGRGPCLPVLVNAVKAHIKNKPTASSLHKKSREREIERERARETRGSKISFYCGYNMISIVAMFQRVPPAIRRRLRNISCGLTDNTNRKCS